MKNSLDMSILLHTELFHQAASDQSATASVGLTIPSNYLSDAAASFAHWRTLVPIEDPKVMLQDVEEGSTLAQFLEIMTPTLT